MGLNRRNEPRKRSMYNISKDAHAAQNADPTRRGRSGLKPFPDRLHVIVPICNFQRFASRYDLFRQFAAHVEESGAELYVIEAALGEREFEVTSPFDPRHIQVRT